MSGSEEKGIIHSAGSGSRGERKAGCNYLLVIAIDEYQHCPRLHNCIKDAQDFVDVLTTHYDFDTSHLHTLYNGDATRANILGELRDMKQRVQAADNLIIYYSGHGETEDKVGYWVPVEAQPERDDEFVSTYDIKSRLDAIDSHHTFVIVDACFSGTLFTTYRSVKAGAEDHKSRLGLAASHSRERALDGQAGENSPFAEKLLKKLRENQEPLGVQKLAAHVIEEVRHATHGRQEPVFRQLDVKGDDLGQYVFHLKAEGSHQAEALVRIQAMDQRVDRGSWREPAAAPRPIRFPITPKQRKLLIFAGALAIVLLAIWIFPQVGSRPGGGAVAPPSNLEPYQVDGKYGYRDPSGNMVIIPQYDAAGPFQGGTAEVTEGGQTFTINESGQCIANCPPADHDETDWAEAMQANTIQSYRAYQQNHPNGRHYLEAGNRIRELDSKTRNPNPPVAATGIVTLGGKNYRTIILNGKTWMAQNLDYDVPDSWHYSGLPEADKSKYGRLYTWQAAKDACAAVGWRLPEDEDWKTLATQFGGYEEWSASTEVGAPRQAYEALLEGGRSNFDAVMGGWYSPNENNTFNLGKFGEYWTATESSSRLPWHYMFHGIARTLARRNDILPTHGFSCRCIQGN